MENPVFDKIVVAHRDLRVGSIHIAHAWEFANENARMGATGFVKTDLLKLAIQLDSLSYWILCAVDPCVWMCVFRPVSNIVVISEREIPPNSVVFIDSRLGGFPLTLPRRATLGDFIELHDAFGTCKKNPVTILPVDGKVCGKKEIKIQTARKKLKLRFSGEAGWI